MNTSRVSLREVRPSDLDVFFAHMQEPAAIHMAAFTPKDPSDRAAHEAQWQRILGNDDMVKRTIEVDGEVAGHIASFHRGDELEVTYWVGSAFWGRGVASRALERFLEIDGRRPMHARVAEGNVGSLRVLERCGFSVLGHDEGFAEGRGATVRESILILGD